MGSAESLEKVVSGVNATFRPEEAKGGSGVMEPK